MQTTDAHPAETLTLQQQIVREALRLHDAGLNVFPLQYGTKMPYHFGKASYTKHLQRTRIHRSDLSSLVAGSNIGVMCGRTSQNLFVLDCDTRDAAEEVQLELDKRGIQAWRRSSNRGAQFWLVCSEGEVDNNPKAIVVGPEGKQVVDVRGRDCYALAAPSFHPDGHFLEWEQHEGQLPEAVTAAQMDFVQGFTLLRGSARRRSVGENTSALPPVANRVLVERCIEGYHSNSEAELGACRSLISTGHTQEQVLCLFARYRPAHYTKVGVKNFTRFILDKVLASSQSNAFNDRRPSIAAPFEQFAQSYQWQGRTGNTDRLVFQGLCHRMRLDGQQPFRATVRELAEMAGINMMTVQRALKRFMAQGFLTREARGKREEGTLYKLALPNLDEAHTVSNTEGLDGKSICASSSHDVWGARALGKTAQLCFDTLRACGPQSAEQLAAKTGKSVKVIQRNLSRLEMHNMVSFDASVWSATDVVDLDKVVQHYPDAVGRNDNRKKLHEQQRMMQASDVVASIKLAWISEQLKGAKDTLRETEVPLPGKAARLRNCAEYIHQANACARQKQVNKARQKEFAVQEAIEADQWVTEHRRQQAACFKAAQSTRPALMSKMKGAYFMAEPENDGPPCPRCGKNLCFYFCEQCSLDLDGAFFACPLCLTPCNLAADGEAFCRHYLADFSNGCDYTFDMVRNTEAWNTLLSIDNLNSTSREHMTWPPNVCECASAALNAMSQEDKAQRFGPLYPLLDEGSCSPVYDVCSLLSVPLQSAHLHDCNGCSVFFTELGGDAAWRRIAPAIEHYQNGLTWLERHAREWA